MKERIILIVVLCTMSLFSGILLAYVSMYNQNKIDKKEVEKVIQEQQQSIDSLHVNINLRADSIKLLEITIDSLKQELVNRNQVQIGYKYIYINKLKNIDNVSTDSIASLLSEYIKNYKPNEN